ncbi:MAG: FUSC family protein [Thermoleophilia bacterium]
MNASRTPRSDPAHALRLEGRRARWLARRLLGPGVGRPAPLGALRMALALSAPLAVGIAMGRRDLAVLATLAAFFTSLMEPGGGYGRHLRVYAVMTALNVMVLMLALACAGHAVAAGLTMLVLGIAAGVATAWGSVPASVGPAVIILFIIAQAFSPAPALGPSVAAVALGSAWVVLLAVIPWPVAPFAPADLAVATAWLAVADLAAHPDVDRMRVSALAALEQARDTLSSIRSRRPGWSGRSARLWAVIVAGSRVTSLVSAVEDERRRETSDPAVRAAMDDVLHEVGHLARGIAAGVVDAHHAPDSRALDQAVDHLRALAPDPDGLTGPALHDALVARSRVRSTRRLRRRLHDAMDALLLPDPPDAKPDRPRRPVARPTLAAALDPRSTALRHGLRLGVATGLSVGTFTALAGTPVFGITHGQWVSIALVGVLRPTLGDSIQVTAQRAAGTALGAVLALVLLVALTGNAWALAGAIVVIGALAAWLQPVNYLWFVVLFTPLSLMLAVLGSPLDASITLERLIATGIACGAGLAIATVLWPSRGGAQLPRALARALQAAAHDLDGALGVAEGRVPRSQMTERNRAALLAMDDAARITQARMAESIEAFSRPDPLAALEASTMQLVRDIGTLAGRIPTEGVAIPGAGHVRTTLTGALDTVAAALETGMAPPDPGDLTTCLNTAHDALTHDEATGSVPMGLAGTLDMLDTIATSITRIADEAGRWAAPRQTTRHARWRRMAAASS